MQILKMRKIIERNKLIGNINLSVTENKPVLIIDDEKNLRSLLSRILTLEDYDIASFESAEEICLLL